MHLLRSCLLVSVATAAALLGSAAPCFAYALEGESWPDGQIRMQLQIALAPRPLSDGKASFNDSALDALNIWNQYLQRVQFVGSIAPAGFTPRDGDNTSSVFSTGTVYGTAFGGDTLAVTLLSFEGTTLTETDLLINNAFTFDSYTGPLRPKDSAGNRVQDIHRILLHEFGHVLGLDHPDQAGQTVSAIMNARVSDLDHLTEDDVAGAHYLYDSTTSGTGSLASFVKIAGSKDQISQMVYSPATGNIYAVGRKKGTGSNRLSVYNPYTLAVLTAPTFADQPDHLAMSDDGRYLYLAYYTATSTQERISRLDLFTNGIDSDFLVSPPVVAGTNTANNITQVADMQVAPGQPDVLAVSEVSGASFSPDNIGRVSLRVYDHGQLRPTSVNDVGTFFAPRLQFVGGPGQLLATPTGGNTRVRRFAVEAGGLSELEPFITQVSDSSDRFVYAGGELFNSVGQALDPVTGGVNAQIVPSSAAIYTFAVNSAADTSFYLTNRSASLLAYSLPSGDSLGSVALPAVTQGHFVEANLLAWGPHGLAFSGPALRSVHVARSVTFDGNPVGGGNPDVLTLAAPGVGSIAQNSGQAVKFRVRRSSPGDSSKALTVHYTVSGTGVNGVNFRALTGSVVIPAGSSKAKIKLVPQPDSLSDGPVSVSVSLAADSEYVVAAPATATVVITAE